MNERTVSRQIAHYGRQSLFNSIALTADAAVAFNHRSWGTSYFLATIAMEEFAKCLIANDAIYNRQANGHNAADSIFWLRRVRDHKHKHYKFARESTDFLPTEFLEQVISRKLENAKQNSLYVDIELSIRDRLFRVSTPRRVREATARRQVSIVHEAIVDLISNTLKGNYILEIGDQIPPIDRETLRIVRRIWKEHYRAKKSRVLEFESQRSHNVSSNEYRRA